LLEGGNRVNQIKQEILDELKRKEELPLFWCTMARSDNSQVQCSFKFGAFERPESESRGLESLVVGERYSISITTQKPGFIHVFNLGSGGDVSKMFPLKGGLCFLEAGIPLALPLAMGSDFWLETGPPTLQTGMGDGILIALTEEEVYLKPEDVHCELGFFRGSMGPWTDGISPLFSLPSDAVRFGYFEYEVRAA
jgi:hypothetical protein